MRASTVRRHPLGASASLPLMRMRVPVPSSAAYRDPHVVVTETAAEAGLGPSPRGPADLAALEAAEPPAWHGHLVADRIAQLRALPPHARPQIADGSVYLVR